MRLRQSIVAGAVMALLSAGSSASAGEWTGCGVGAHAGYAMGMAGAPVGVGSSGEMLGVSVNCDIKVEQRIVLGAFADFDWFLGDLHSVGAREDLTIGARAGYLVLPYTLVYGHGGWSRVYTTGSDVDGWKAGGGVEFKLPNSPLYIDTRYTYADYGTVAGIPEVKASEIRLGVTYKFFEPGAPSAARASVK